MKRNKLLLLLALLLTAATGAWATDYTTLAVGDVIKVGDTFTPTDDGGFNDIGVNSGVTYTLMRADVDNDYNVTEKTDGAYYVFKYVSIMSSPYIHFEKAFAVTAISDGLEVTNIDNMKGKLFYTLAVHESAAPATTYTVSVKDGVKDADKWTITPNPAEEGQTVTLQYNGRLKVKGVKATSDAAPAAATPALSITSPSVGQVIGSDGKNYAYGSLPTGVTAVAKICYVSGSNGLALALTDEGALDWSTAIETCAAHTPAFTGGTWKLASLDEWNNMITTAGNQTDLRDGFSSVGGTNMEENCYWSSSEVDSESAWLYYFGNGQGYSIDDYKDVGYYVRACLAFTAEQAAAKTPATVTTAPTAKSGVKAGEDVAIVNAGVADGGTLMYAVTTTNTKPTSTEGFSADVPTAQTCAAGTVYVWYYVKANDTHTDSEIAGPVSVAVAEATPALSLTSPSVGQVIGSDGKNYAAASVPSGVTKVAMIAYVSGSNGLAIALADEGSLNWATAKSTCDAKTPAFTGGTWMLPTKDEWNQMFSANGGSAESYTGLNTAITTAGGTSLQGEGGYWSSTPDGSWAYYVRLQENETSWRSQTVSGTRQVRACLAF